MDNPLLIPFRVKRYRPIRKIFAIFGGLILFIGLLIFAYFLPFIIQNFVIIHGEYTAVDYKSYVQGASSKFYAVDRAYGSSKKINLDKYSELDDGEYANKVKQDINDNTYVVAIINGYGMVLQSVINEYEQLYGNIDYQSITDINIKYAVSKLHGIKIDASFVLSVPVAFPVYDEELGEQEPVVEQATFRFYSTNDEFKKLHAVGFINEISRMTFGSENSEDINFVLATNNQTFLNVTKIASLFVGYGIPVVDEEKNNYFFTESYEMLLATTYEIDFLTFLYPNYIN
jgi:nitric oxide reductase large subunit